MVVSKSQWIFADIYLNAIIGTLFVAWMIPKERNPQPSRNLLIRLSTLLINK